MPFIRGRYYINPTAGEALEKARDAENALTALQQGPSDDSRSDDYEWAPTASSDNKGPIHRVEIETASLVPAYSGGATRGYVARIHRASYTPSTSAQASLKPETHAFSSHGDLVDFLANELEKDAAQSEANRGARG